MRAVPLLNRFYANELIKFGTSARRLIFSCRFGIQRQSASTRASGGILANSTVAARLLFCLEPVSAFFLVVLFLFGLS